MRPAKISKRESGFLIVGQLIDPAAAGGALGPSMNLPFHHDVGIGGKAFAPFDTGGWSPRYDAPTPLPGAAFGPVTTPPSVPALPSDGSTPFEGGGHWWDSAGWPVVHPRFKRRRVVSADIRQPWIDNPGLEGLECTLHGSRVGDHTGAEKSRDSTPAVASWGGLDCALLTNARRGLSGRYRQRLPVVHAGGDTPSSPG